MISMTDITEKNNSTALSAVFILARARRSVGQMNFACVLGFLRELIGFLAGYWGGTFFGTVPLSEWHPLEGFIIGISGVGTVSD